MSDKPRLKFLTPLGASSKSAHTLGGSERKLSHLAKPAQPRRCDGERILVSSADFRDGWTIINLGGKRCGSDGFLLGAITSSP